MCRWFAQCVLGFLWLPLASGDALYLDFAKTPLGQTPTGFTSTVAGTGKPGRWEVVTAEVPPAIPRFSLKSSQNDHRPVLAQLAEDLADEHFPLLVYDTQEFGNFTLTTKFKTVSGVIERMAGLVFRYQDAKNFYYVRASSLGNSFAFFKVVNGERGEPIRVETPVTTRQWHAMSVTCDGNRIRLKLDGKQIIPELTDSTFSSGKIGFWTKSDSITYFVDTFIRFEPRVIRAQKLVNKIMRRYPRILALRIFARKNQGEAFRVIAAYPEKLVQEPADSPVESAAQTGKKYFARTRHSFVLTLPIDNRNGDPVAALRLTLKRFRGQTRSNAMVRSQPILAMINSQVLYLKDLFQ